LGRAPKGDSGHFDIYLCRRKSPLLASPWSAVARPLRLLILAVAYLAAVAVVVGVIGVRFHYFTDTVAGTAVGTGTVCGLALVLDLIPGVWPSRMGLSRLQRPA
jgi:membrane-associated phospholipid phosphatase